jgi:hypothetical protein
MIERQRKVAIFSPTSLWIERHPEAIELAWRLYSENNALVWISCDKGLASCPANPKHLATLCFACKGQDQRSTSKLLPPGVIIAKFDRQVEEPLDLVYPQNWIDLLQYHYEQMPIGALVASQLSDDFSDISVPDDRILNRGRDLIESGVHLYKWTQNLIAEMDICEFYAWNGRRPSDGPALYAAKSMDVDYKAFISDLHGTIRVENEFFVQTSKGFMNNFHRSQDQTISSDDWNIVHSFFNRLRFGVSDDKYFSHFNKWNTKKFEIGESIKPIIALFASSVWETVGLKDMSVGEALNPFSEIEKITQLCSDPDINLKWRVIVRFHPNQTNSGPVEKRMIRELVDNHPDIEFIRPGSVVSSYSLLDSADLVLTFGSTIGLEAAWHGKPSVIYGRALYENAGFCYHFTNFESLKNGLLNADFHPANVELVARYVMAVISSNSDFMYITISRFGSKLGSVFLEQFVVPKRLFRLISSRFSKLFVYRYLKSISHRTSTSI